MKGTSPAVYQYGSEWITLDEFESPLLWALFDEATRLGIALVGSDATPEVAVRRSASIGLDASLDSGGDLTLVPTVVVDDDAYPVSSARPIARHGLYRFDFDRGPVSYTHLTLPTKA